MATQFKLAGLGEDIESGDVLSILVGVGDSISQGQPVMEIKFDKATVTKIFAPISGVIREIHVERGKIVKTGQLLLTIDEKYEKEGGREPEMEVKEQADDDKEEKDKQKTAIENEQPKVIEFSHPDKATAESESYRHSSEVLMPRNLISRRHHWVVRLTHWINSAALTIMVTSGLRIFNAYPMFARRGESFCCYPFDSTRIPEWLTFGGWLAGARNWHFAMMWLLVLNGMVYLGFIYLHGEWRDVTPRRGDPRDAWEMFKFYTFLRKEHPRQEKHNTLQKLTYFTMPLIGIVAVITGIAIWKPVQFGFLTNLLGGYVWARYWHFMAMVTLMALSLAHVVMVFAVDPYSLPSMITGRYNEKYSPERRNARPFYNLLPGRESISEEKGR